MIQIQVTSPIMESVRKFKSDTQALSFMKKVKKLHVTYGKHIAGKKPTRRDFKTNQAYRNAINIWTLTVNSFSVNININHLTN